MATQVNTPKSGARGRAGKAAAKGRTKGQTGGAAGADNARTDSSISAVATKPKPRKPTPEIKAAAARCAALGDPARLQILEVMTSGGSFSPTKIAEQLGIEGETVSTHLKAMGKVGFYEKQGQRNNAEYTITPAGAQAWQTARTFGGNSGNAGA